MVLPQLSKKFTRREKILLLILCLLLIGALYFWLVHIPVSNSLVELQGRQIDAQNQISALQAKDAKMQQMRQELEQLKSAENTAVTPPYNNLENVVAFLNAVMGAAQDYSLNFQEVQLPQDSSIVRRGIQMSFVAENFTQAKEMVLSLRGSPYRCQLSELNMFRVNRSDTSGGLETGPVQISLTITFFEQT